MTPISVKLLSLAHAVAELVFSLYHISRHSECNEVNIVAALDYVGCGGVG